MTRTSLFFPLCLSAAVLLAACETAMPLGGEGWGGNEPDNAAPAVVNKTPRIVPDFGPPVTSKRRAVPISGGTLATRGRIVVASDPDRDQVSVVDLSIMRENGEADLFTVDVPEGSEPGRAVIDTRGRAHVVLREAGSIATIDIATRDMRVHPICAAPRGIDYDADTGSLAVACAEGALVRVASTPREDGSLEVLSRTAIPEDARDVLIRNGKTFVSTFRRAEVFEVSDAGLVPMNDPADADERTVAWRLLPPGNDAHANFAMLGQRVSTRVRLGPPTGTTAGPTTGSAAGSSGSATSYGGHGTDCDNAVVTPTLFVGTSHRASIAAAVLAVDAVPVGNGYAVASAGNTYTSSANVFEVVSSDPCGRPIGRVPGEATALVVDRDGRLLVQTREPAAIHVLNPADGSARIIARLGTESMLDTGHMVFHSNAGAGIACASCHPEGGDDGHTWNFVVGNAGMPRRTPSLRGTIKNSAPYHWEGDQKDLGALMNDVFVGRMSGPNLTAQQVDVFSHWLEAIPPPKPFAREDSEAALRGKSLYDAGGCATCHASGTGSFDVGTGGRFQAPPLVGVGSRAPYMHNGCARTLEGRFVPSCGGSAHGPVEFSWAERLDLIEYLKTL